MTTPIRILIVDDDPNVRRGLRMRLGLDPQIRIVGDAADGLAAVEQAVALRPDVVLLDLNLPGMDGIAACQRIHAERIPVVMFSLEDSQLVQQRCLAAGAAAFVSKQDGILALVAALRDATGPQQFGNRSTAFGCCGLRE